MPITLVTGLPGHGKTLYSLARWKPEAEKAGRPVFHNSIPGLNIPGWQEWDIKNWQNLPAGAIFIVDEAQFAFPVTGKGQTPEWVQKLATHRHLGIDFVVITQNPMLLDSFVRRLVDRHFHVVRKFGTKFATVYEFVNGVKEDVAKNRNDGIRSEFRYPKEVYNWYKSAELHTVKARIPARVYMLLILPIMFLGLVWLGYQRMKPETKQQELDQALGITAEKNFRSKPAEGPKYQRPDASAKMSAAEYMQAHTPRIPGLPHTAPVYDGVTSPQQAPYPAACLASKARCQCYSQQGTRMDIEEKLCRSLADGGFFVAWNAAGERVQATPKAANEVRKPDTQMPGYGSLGPSSPPQFAATNPPPDEGAGSLPTRVRRAVQ